LCRNGEVGSTASSANQMNQADQFRCYSSSTGPAGFLNKIVKLKSPGVVKDDLSWP